MMTLRRATPLVGAARRLVGTAQVRVQQPSAITRQFASEPVIRRPKAVKVKKGDARRRIEPKPKPEATDALVEQQEYSQVPAQYNQGPFQPQQPSSFGGMMKESFFWGIGMAIAFTFVGIIFGRMEEAQDREDVFDRSEVVIKDKEEEDEA